MTNAKLLTFIWKRQTVRGKRGENMVTWPLLPFAVNVMLNLPIIRILRYLVPPFSEKGPSMISDETDEDKTLVLKPINF